MKIATIPLNGLPPVPKSVKASARQFGIETFIHGVPFGASCWIACAEAMPHRDPGWSKDFFLTLTVAINNPGELEDAKCAERYDGVLHVGQLCVVDPLVRHWLIPKQTGGSSRPKSPQWVGLQWEVRRNKAKQKAREIVEQLGGTWLSSWQIDRRYAKWHPEAV